MYSIYASFPNGTDICIYDDTVLESGPEKLVLNPVLRLADNSAGSFVFVLPPGNAGYTSVERLTSTITIRKQDSVIWQGRVIEESVDFWNNRVLTCEGALAWLNDVIIPKRIWNAGCDSILNYVINLYNTRVPAERQFTKGLCHVSSVLNDYNVDFCNGYSMLFEKMIEKCGGNIVLKYSEAGGSIVRTIDYITKDQYVDNSQKIQFGENLLDFTRNWNMSDFCTSVVPLGKTVGTGEDKLTIAEVNENSIYLTAETADTYGVIERVVEFSDIDNAHALKAAGWAYLNSMQFDNMVIELSAIDLHYLNPSVTEFKLLDNVQFVSKPHNMDKKFPVTQIELPLDHPEDTRYVFGYDQKPTISGESNKTNTELIDSINKLPKENHILEEARQNSQDLVDSVTKGYVTLVPNTDGGNTLLVTQDEIETEQDAINKGKGYWKWNHEGLVYKQKDDYGTWYSKNAFTSDGTLATDCIAAHSLSVDQIKAFTVSADDIVGGVLKGKDNKFSFDLRTGYIIAQDIRLGSKNGSYGVHWEANDNPNLKGIYSDSDEHTLGIASENHMIKLGPQLYWWFDTSGLHWHDKSGSYVLDKRVMLKE